MVPRSSHSEGLPPGRRKLYTKLMQARTRPWVFDPDKSQLPLVDSSVSSRYLLDEAEAVGVLLDRARLSQQESHRVAGLAVKLVKAMRRNRKSAGGLDAFMSEYDLSSSEGIVLMCLAEALLRIPDAETADRLIADKLGEADWQSHLGTSDSLFVNASTWGLMLTGKIVRLPDPAQTGSITSIFGQLIKKSGEPVIRNALRQAMRVMGDQFVLGRTIQEAIKRARVNG